MRFFSPNAADSSAGDSSRVTEYYEFSFRMFRYSDTNALDQLPKSKWPRVVHDFQTTLRLDSIRVDSIHFNVRKWRERVRNMLKPYQFYPGAHMHIKGTRSTSKPRSQLLGIM